MKVKALSLLSLLVPCAFAWAEQETLLFDLEAIRDASSLEVEVLQDWRLVPGEPATRQKLVSIKVGELLPGRPYRVPVRMVVPSKAKAKGFHLTGSHNPGGLARAVPPRGVDAELLNGGVGLVQTVVQVLRQSGQGELGTAADEAFVKTLDPRHSIQYWGWPATLMRAVTAAYAEKEHFKKGKVAMSGGSKNGASPSCALIHDDRMTAVFGAVSPIWESPLRLCDRKAWDALRAYNERYADQVASGRERFRLLRHPFLGGTFGPVYNQRALEAGHSWEDLRKLAERMADKVFVSRNLKALAARRAELLFHPGTHDFVCFDLAWGGEHYPQIPLHLSPNTGHGKRGGHPGEARGEQNKAAFLLNHFFGGDETEALLEPPTVKARREGKLLQVEVAFKPGSAAETGRIFWMFDRGPDGSAAYVREPFPDDLWKEMTFHPDSKTWRASIPLKAGAIRIDFFSNHRKTLRRPSGTYPTYLSSPYRRFSVKE